MRCIVLKKRLSFRFALEIKRFKKIHFFGSYFAVKKVGLGYGKRGRSGAIFQCEFVEQNGQFRWHRAGSEGTLRSFIRLLQKDAFTHLV